MYVGTHVIMHSENGLWLKQEFVVLIKDQPGMRWLKCMPGFLNCFCLESQYNYVCTYVCVNAGC